MSSKLASNSISNAHFMGNIALTTSSLNQNINQGADLKIASIRANVLQTIRNHMPITTLFTPELKIDLSMFIKDQMLIHRIAEFIASLVKADPIDSISIAKHFEGSELLSEIKTMFKQDPSPYLAFIYEVCSDVLNEKSFSNSLKSAIEGRIFTLKNALIAQHTPEAIYKSQVQNAISSQTISSIKEEGASFIRESLRLHLHALKGAKSSSFREHLISTAEQLIPFIQKITSIYLKENGKSCPTNPLTFRNPTGYNHHGLVAATVMESCLNALGYTTRIMGRSDLEPRVTLSTAHNVVEVTGPDNLRYIIDPSYIQFHKDVCLEDALLPTSPVLVLKENEVDEYIKNNIMVNWKTNFQLVSKNDTSTINKLRDQDQLISYIIDKLKLPKEVTPSNLEDWVRKAFKRVWGLSTYSPILSDQGFQDIFNGIGELHNTYDSIKSMRIAPLTHHLSYSEVEKCLENLLCDQTSKGQNSIEALSLIAQLPILKRIKYASLLDLDPRLQGGMDISLNAYFRSLKKVVNPQGKDLSVIYGCSGGDCTSVLFATDAQDLIFVDLTKTPLSEFETALTQLRSRNNLFERQIKDRLEKTDNFFSFRSRYSGSMSRYSSDGKHHMNDLALKLLLDLQEIGVNLDTVVLTSVEDGVRIDFSWQYHGAACSRKRNLTFLTADITNTDAYPALLKKKLKDGFDIFFMKGAFFVPQSYPHFLPHIAKSINLGGWLMTADKTWNMETVNPEQCLEQNDLTFTFKKSEETRSLEELMNPPFDPLFVIPVLQMAPTKRIQRNSGTDLSYWSILSLRQKSSNASSM